MGKERDMFDFVVMLIVVSILSVGLSFAFVLWCLP